jgi:hypothetical protein
MYLPGPVYFGYYNKFLNGFAPGLTRFRQQWSSGRIIYLFELKKVVN